MSYTQKDNSQQAQSPGSNTRPSYHDYGDLWNFNLQKIEQIHQRIEESIRDLENSYAGFESRYADLDHQLDILSSIYAGYNTITGLEDIMKLKALLRTYRRRYTREGMDFDLVHSLMTRISDARSVSFESFPALSHDSTAVACKRPDTVLKDYSGKKYKWITFERNRSWFIVPYRSIEIKRSSGFPVISVEEPDIINVDIDGRVVRSRDIFIKSPDRPEKPRYILMINGDRNNLAAGNLGREIFSDHDFISPMIKPFKKASSNALSPGRVRLFGRNHILLYQT
jgi:hypothetical protein